MSANIDFLAAEIDRILNSPYPTQLKTLHDIASKCTDTNIRLWAQYNTCRLNSLALSLAKALPHWPYVLNIITRLCCAVELRDAIVQIEPTLLVELLSHAADSNFGNNKYTQASVALLSHRLPDHIALPSHAQTLLIALFERAVTHPVASNIRPIYQVINGAGRDLIGILPFEVLTRLEQHLFTILSAPTGVEDQSLGLYCLAIMRIISEQFKSDTSSTPEDLWAMSNSSSADGQSERWNSDAISHFFQGRKTHKTMQLVALRVVFACRLGSDEANAEALTSVILANEVITAVAESVRAEWCNKNPNIIRKLQEKCVAANLIPDLRFQALTFLGALPSSLAIPSQATSLYGKLVLDIEQLVVPQEQYRQSLRLSLHRYTPLLDQSWWQRCLSSVLEVAASTSSSQIVRSASLCLSLLEKLTTMVQDSPSCRAAVLAAFAMHDIRHKLEELLTVKVASTSRGFQETVGICACSITSFKEALAKSVCTLLLQSALSSQPQEHQLPTQLVSSALHRHARVLVSPPCAHRRQRNAHADSRPLLVEVKSTPVMHDAPTHWRNRLATSIQAQAKNQEQALLASFSEICRDLEDRCENVEGPLREEREKAANLDSRYRDLTAAYSDLESRMLDRDLRINALEADNDRHNTEMEAVATESEELMQRIDQILRELEDSKANVRKVLADAKQERHELEMEHSTTLACKQEALDRLREQAQGSEEEAQRFRTDFEQSREQVQSSKNEIQRLRGELEQMSEGHKQDTSDQIRLRSELSDSEQRLREMEDRLNNTEVERRALAEKNVEMDQEANNLRKDLEQQQRERDSLSAALEDTKAQSKDEMRTATCSFEETMAKAKQEWTESREGLEHQIETAQQELVRAEEALQEQHILSKQKKLELRKKIDHLTKDCLAKDAQVIEMQERWNRMMMAMGQPPAPPPESLQKSSMLPYRSGSTMATPKPSSQLAHETPMNRGEEPDDEEIDISLSSSVSSNAGPTPKRARSRPAAVPEAALQRPRTSIGGRSARTLIRTRSAMKRQPLLDLSANRSPSKTNKSPSKVAFKKFSTVERNELEDWSFTTADGVLTSTPGLGLREGRDLDDMSTADV